jgi:zinc protease
MVPFDEFKLDNGLTLIVNPDHSSPIVVLNILYKVGSRNEDPDKTGFAHLFEHLMFGGSKNVKSFDEPLQAVGGDNNAFTNADITNYYTLVPKTNVETAFWLESDRMLSLSFDQKVLTTQKNVVIEEFRQRYLNQPYGDVWLKLRPEAYKVHPYRWPTIGKEISHVENATMDDVKDFFEKYYSPSNAVLVVAGDITSKQAYSLTEKWFGSIPDRGEPNQDIPNEPSQVEERELHCEAEVPHDLFYQVYHMPGRKALKQYHALDLFSDILGRGKSSLLYQELVKKHELLHSVSSYVTGNLDPGLLVISGKLNKKVEFSEIFESLERVLESVTQEINEKSLAKVKNMAESSMIFGEIEVLNRAMNLAYATFLGDPNLVNTEQSIIKEISIQDIKLVLNEYLLNTNRTTLYYHKK